MKIGNKPDIQIFIPATEEHHTDIATIQTKAFEQRQKGMKYFRVTAVDVEHKPSVKTLFYDNTYGYWLEGWKITPRPEPPFVAPTVHKINTRIDKFMV